MGIKIIARNAKAFRHELMVSEWDGSSSSSSSDEDKDDYKQSSLALSGDFDSLSIFKKVGPLFTIVCHG